MKPLKRRTPTLPRFLINPNKIAPYNTIGVGDWVVFSLCDGDCKIGKIVGFNIDYITSDCLAVIETPMGEITKRNIFFDIENGAMYKIDPYCTENITIIKED